MTSPLDDLHVARPCPASWEAMDGDARVRHCGLCQLHVYNLSEMTEAEALRLVRETEGRLCVRFFRRADGTVLTRDCPGAVPAPAPVAQRLALAAALAGALAASDVAVDAVRSAYVDGVPVSDAIMGDIGFIDDPDGMWTAGEPMDFPLPPPPPPPPPPPAPGG